MNQFVDDCRREWKRLGVPDPVADEMAAELTADLEEAEAEGASAEDVLGSGAFDARSFAGAWATERGVIEPRNGNGLPRRSRLPIAIAAFTVIAIVGAVLVVLATPSASRRPASFSVADLGLPPRPAAVPSLRRVAVKVLPEPGALPTLVTAPGPAPVLGISVRAAVSPDGRRLAFVRDGRVVVVALGDLRESGVDTRTVGSILLSLGLAGILLLTVSWWVGARRLSRRPAAGY